MGGEGSKTVSYPQTVNGKYRIARNVHASCRIDIMEEDADSLKLFLGVKKKADSTVVVGTRIFLDTPASKSRSVIRPQGGSKEDIECASVMVREVSQLDGKALLVCSGIQRETLSERRRLPRREVSFPVRLNEVAEAEESGKDYGKPFIAIQGNTQGLTLQADNGQKTLTRLVIDRHYNFTVRHKEIDYTLPGTIRHIRYDWKDYRHCLGVSFAALTSEQEVVLNLLLDPSYSIPISTSQTIDTSQGKISD